MGARLTYRIGDDTHEVLVTLDTIHVKPLPKLKLDYFITSEVFGDDAWTTEIESSIPFTLEGRVKNTGYGRAANLKINSGHPKIVENELRLLIGFTIIGSQVNGKEATKSLKVDFNDIEPNGSGLARWLIICFLSSVFTEFTADYSHSDSLGGEMTSLIDGDIDTHFLVWNVLLDPPKKDLITDFLTRDSDDYKLYRSNGIDENVYDQSGSASLTL